MTILAWLIVGLVAGWGANRLIGSGSYGLIGDIVVGILGAVVVAWLVTPLLGIDVIGINLTSIAVGGIGAVILIAFFRALSPGRGIWHLRR